MIISKKSKFRPIRAWALYRTIIISDRTEFLGAYPSKKEAEEIKILWNLGVSSANYKIIPALITPIDK